MSQGDIIGLILSYIYAFGLLLIVEALGRQLSWPQHLTRKVIHIGAGMWTWGILYFFDHWYFGVIPFATFIVMNYVFYRRQTFQQMRLFRKFLFEILQGLLFRDGRERPHDLV